jgi:hypothetical protein
VDPYRQDLVRDARERPPTLALVLLNATIDLLFLAIWFLVHFQADLRLFSKLQLTGVTKFSASVLQWSFDISTLIPIVAFLAADTVRSVWRILLELGRSLRGM